MPQNTPKPTDLSPVLAAVSPEEAIAFFVQKGFKIGFDYRDVWQQEHQAAFSVAKAMQIDVLQDIKAAVDAAIENGTTLAAFQKTLTPLLQAKGWWGKKEQTDPLSGEIASVQLGSPRRLELIYDTNVATAYSEGQWERIQRNKDLFPFLEYVRSASVNPRHTHLAYAGLVLPADDAFWQSHLPIKEWGCKCTVVQHSRRMLEREGLTVGKAPPEVMRTVVNKRTSQTMQVPTGVDPAFHYPPGGRRAHLEKMLADKQAAASSTASPRVLAQRAAAQMKDVVGQKVVHNMGQVNAAARVLAATGFDLAGYSSVFDNSAVRHTLNNHGDVKKEMARGQLPVSVADWAHLPGILDAADDVFADGKTRQGRDALVYTKMIDGEGYWLVMELRSPKTKLQAQVTMRKKKGAWSQSDRQNAN
jgi:Phage Mu protein F like protein/phage-Barnase-EndoU-ColicinE5/D-RelE like nuclease3